MKYVLIDSNNDIVDTIDSVTPGGAEHYFMKRKKMEDKESFYNVWKIKTKKEYELNKVAFERKASSEWWEGEETYLDIDKPQGVTIMNLLSWVKGLFKKKKKVTYIPIRTRIKEYNKKEHLEYIKNRKKVYEKKSMRYFR